MSISMTPTFDVTITLLAYLFCLTSTSVSLLGYLLSTKTVRHSSSCCTLPGRNPLKKGIMFKYRSSQIQLRFSFYVIQEAPSKWRKRKKEKILGLDIKKKKRCPLFVIWLAKRKLQVPHKGIEVLFWHPWSQQKVCKWFE